jgi:hypothetical protein
MAAFAQLFGQMGEGYQKARDTQTTEQNELAKAKESIQARLQQQANVDKWRQDQEKLRVWTEQQRQHDLNEKIGVFKEKDGTYSILYRNKSNGVTTRVALAEGETPDTDARQADEDAAKTGRQTQAEKARADAAAKRATQQDKYQAQGHKNREAENVSREKLSEHLKAYAAAHPTQKANSPKESAAIQLRERQAQWVIKQGRHLLDMLQDPDIQDMIGPGAGMISGAELATGTASKKLADFNAALESFLNLQPALHGSRGKAMVDEFRKALPAGLRSDPDELEGGIESLMQTSYNYFVDDIGKVDPAQALMLLGSSDLGVGGDQPPMGGAAGGPPAQGGQGGPPAAPYNYQGHTYKPVSPPAGGKP